MDKEEDNKESIGEMIERRKQENEAFMKLLKEMENKKSETNQTTSKSKKQ